MEIVVDMNMDIINDTCSIINHMISSTSIFSCVLNELRSLIQYKSVLGCMASFRYKTFMYLNSNILVLVNLDAYHDLRQNTLQLRLCLN
jgi:hypothetical protein